MGLFSIFWWGGLTKAKSGPAPAFSVSRSQSAGRIGTLTYAKSNASRLLAQLGDGRRIGAVLLVALGEGAGVEIVVALGLLPA